MDTGYRGQIRKIASTFSEWTSGKARKQASFTTRNHRLRFERLEDRRMLAVISIGSGDGSVQVDVDGYGAIGLAQGSSGNEAIIDPIGPEVSTGVIWESMVAIGAGADRHILTDGAFSPSQPLPDVTVSISLDNTTATSSFTLSSFTGSLAAINGLEVDLTQELTSVFDGGSQVGAILSQTYVLNNPTLAVMDIDLIRYADVDVAITESKDGGGRIVLGGEEWLVTTGNDMLSDLSQPDIFVAISTAGGEEPLTGRFKVEKWDPGGILIDNTILPGNELDDSVFNDSADADELIDIATYDTTGALRSDFILAPGESATFITNTLFADGIPEDILTDTGNLLNTAPTITDVILDGSGWTGKDPVSYAARIAAGEQYRTIATEGVNTLTIEFSEDVTLDGSALELRHTELTAGGATINSIVPFGTSDTFLLAGNVATWTFSTDLADGKYAILLPDDLVTDLAGNKLDAEWSNPNNGTLDNFTDDSADPFYEGLPPEFITGDGTAGSDDTDMNGSTEFRFHFALLAGDYNGDGIVEHNGETTGDGNGDGNVDGFDVNLGTDDSELPLRAHGGADLKDDEGVNGDDLAIWSANFGPNAGGDIDGDLDTDGLDYLAWAYQFGSTSAWYTGAPIAPLQATAFDPNFAPQVTNVTISGSQSQHADFSFDTVDGSGEQLRTVPVGGADTISITFSELVNVTSGSLSLIGLSTANVPALAEFSYDNLTMTATWRFVGWSLGDNYLVGLNDNSVTDLEGEKLDGEWTNPASLTTLNAAISEFPSGNGVAGGRFDFVMTLLPGDADLNGVIDAIDAGILFANWGVSGGALFDAADFNGDGLVDAIDFALQTGGNWALNLQDIWILADLDSDYDVDPDDYAIFFANLDQPGTWTWADGDLDGDGQVTLDDLALMFALTALDIDVVA